MPGGVWGHGDLATPAHSRHGRPDGDETAGRGMDACARITRMKSRRDLAFSAELSPSRKATRGGLVALGRSPWEGAALGAWPAQEVFAGPGDG